MIFEAVEVLVTLATIVAAEWLFLFHAEGSRVGRRGLGVNN